MLCKHGCGNEAVYKDRCDKAWSKCPELIRKNSEGLKRAHAEGLLGVSQFDGKRGWSKNKSALSDERLYRCSVYSKDEAEVLINDSRYWTSVIKYLKFTKIKIFNCNHLQWMDKKLTQVLHHVNGNKKDCRKENLQWLCPNCHSLTDNFGFRGRTHSKESITKGVETRRRNRNAAIDALVGQRQSQSA